MADHKYGCAVIVDRGKIAGMFTTVDALNALAQLLEEKPRTSYDPPRSDLARDA